MWDAVRVNVLGRFPPSSAGASETHSSPAVAGYQPKNGSGKNLRTSSLPPPDSSASAENNGNELINAPPLDVPMGGQAERVARPNTARPVLGTPRRSTANRFSALLQPLRGGSVPCLGSCCQKKIP